MFRRSQIEAWDLCDVGTGPVSSGLERVIEENRARIRSIVRSSVNRGLGATLNGLWDQLGEEIYVFRQDADDVSMQGRFKLQIEAVRRDPEIGVIGGAIIEFEALAGSQDSREALRRYPSEHRDCIAKLPWGSPVAHPAVMFNRAALPPLLRYPSVGLNEDIALWFELASKGVKFSNLSAPILRFRVSSNTISRRGRQKALRELQIYLAGVWRLFGPSWRLMPPVLRYTFRMMPAWIIRCAYRNVAFRNLLLNRRSR